MSVSLCWELRQETEREVSRDEGAAFARKHGCLFVETSAKANVAVGQAFEELVRKVPALRLWGSGVQGIRLCTKAMVAVGRAFEELVRKVPHPVLLCPCFVELGYGAVMPMAYL